MGISQEMHTGERATVGDILESTEAVLVGRRRRVGSLTLGRPRSCWEEGDIISGPPGCSTVELMAGCWEGRGWSGVIATMCDIECVYISVEFCNNIDGQLSYSLNTPR